MFLRWVWASLLVCLLPLTIQADANCRRSMDFSKLCPNPMMQASMASFQVKDEEGNCRFYGKNNSNNDKNLTLVGFHVSEDRWKFEQDTFTDCQFYLKLNINGPETTNACTKSFEMGFVDSGVFQHNFTLNAENGFAKGFDFEDYTNTKNVELICAAEPRFVSMLFMSYRDDGCSIIVRQHTVTPEFQTCNYISPACGVYPCSHLEYLLLDLKLKTVITQEVNDIESEENTRAPWYNQVGQKVMGILNATFPEYPNNQTRCNISDGMGREQSILLAISMAFVLVLIFRAAMLRHSRLDSKNKYKNVCPVHSKEADESTLPTEKKKLDV